MSAPPAHPRFWKDWTSSEFAAADLSSHIAVLPLGATEQHGPHLPLDVDSAIVDGIIQRSLPLLPATLPLLILPPVQVGHSLEHRDFCGTLSLSVGTALGMCRDLGASVAATGIRKLVFLNGHGGNVSLMDLAGRYLRADHGLMVFSVHWTGLGLPDGIIDDDELRFGIHGGRLETSVMLALNADRVRFDKARNFPSLRQRHARNHALLGDGRSARLSWMMQDLNPQGAAGNAAAARADEGNAILDHTAQRWIDLLQDIHRVPIDELAPPPLPPSHLSDSPHRP